MCLKDIFICCVNFVSQKSKNLFQSSFIHANSFIHIAYIDQLYICMYVYACLCLCFYPYVFIYDKFPYMHVVYNSNNNNCKLKELLFHCVFLLFCRFETLLLLLAHCWRESVVRHPLPSSFSSFVVRCSLLVVGRFATCRRLFTHSRTQRILNVKCRNFY